MFKPSSKKFIILFLLILFLIAFSVNDLSAKKKKKKRYRPKIVNIQIKQEKIIADSIVNPGIRFQNLLLGDGKRWFNIYLTKIDLQNPINSVFVGKSKSHISGLADFVDFLSDNQNLTNIQTMINANFWSAYRNYPIGPSMIDGELITFRRYKQWSSLFLDKNNIPYIDNYDITGKLIVSSNLQFEIESVNRRRDSISLCFYNHFAGDTIPYVQAKNSEKALDSAYFIWMQEKALYLNEDDTEQEFDTLSFIEDYKASLRQNMIEHQTNKILCQYIDPPSVNSTSRVVVRNITKNSIEVPKGYCVFTYGEYIGGIYSPRIGDTLQLQFQTNFDSNVVFFNAVSGTPRISRKGVYKNEAILEGNSDRRFINHQLPRTMVGYDKSKKWLYLIVVNGTGSGSGCYGASLKDLEKVAKHLQLYDSMNLDGGGSSAFIFQGINKLRKSNPYSSRKLSVYLGVRIN